MNYYDEIKERLVKNEVCKKVREYYTNKNDLTTYYEVGKLLSMGGKHYGEGIIKEFAVKLKYDVGKKYSITTLKYMRLFYYFAKSQPSADHFKNLTWSHYLEILPLKDVNEINYYINIAVNQNLSRNDLRRKIKSQEYQRLDNKTKLKLIHHEKIELIDYIKNPIILHKSKDYNRITEYALKEIIMNDLDNFLKQLGNGYCYIGNEYKIKIGNYYSYIDIMLFNIIFNCYIVVELKIHKFTKQDIGQIQVYMNYVNKNIKNINQDNTIGIIVCKENNKYLIKYSTDKRIHAVSYELV